MICSLLYLHYLARHKLYVWLEGRKLGVHWWRLLIHDWSKFTSAEWGPYCEHFYGRTKPGDRKHDPLFQLAWDHHIRLNDHHWEYWTTMHKGVRIQALSMPDQPLREMVADWNAMSRALGNPPLKWYREHRVQIVMHEPSRRIVERLLGYAE